MEGIDIAVDSGSSVGGMRVSVGRGEIGVGVNV
jgi:hypothetical protein